MLYAFLAKEMECVKLGFTNKKDYRARLRTTRTHCPCEIIVLAVGRGGRAAEQKVHERFAADRGRGEWFRLTPELLRYLATSKRWRLLAYGLLLAAADREPKVAEAMSAWQGTWRERAARRLAEQYE